MYSSVDDLQLARRSAGSASGDAQPSASASQSAALTSAQQALVDDIKSFGRMPGARFSFKFGKFPNPIGWGG